MKPLPGDPGLPPGVTDRQIAEEGTHDLERCAGCGALFLAAVLDDNMHCPFCAEPDADMGRMEHDDRGDN
jgi:hypothetical protein